MRTASHAHLEIENEYIWAPAQWPTGDAGQRQAQVKEEFVYGGNVRTNE